MDNFNKISDGMTISQVEAILGKGEAQASSADTQIINWQNSTKVISITFSNGKVMSKAQNGL